MARNASAKLPWDMSQKAGYDSSRNPPAPATSSGLRPTLSDSAPMNGTRTATTARHAVVTWKDCTELKPRVWARWLGM
ncbi:hypothetical protein HFP72_01655 [Nocardiopsis sp. ARC36]